MPRYRNDPQPKPIEEWTAKEWETAYHILMKKFDELKVHMRLALNFMNKAGVHLSEAVS